MKRSIILKPHEALALSRGETITIWRACKPQPQLVLDNAKWSPTPYPLDVPLLGKETWCEASPEHRDHENVPQAFYKAQSTEEGEEIRQEYIRLGHDYRWKSPSHQPEWAVRTRVTLSDVRVRKPCDVTEEEAKAMGVCKYPWMATGLDPEKMRLVTDPDHCRRIFQERFLTLHGDINLYHWSYTATPVKP